MAIGPRDEGGALFDHRAWNDSCSLNTVAFNRFERADPRNSGDVFAVLFHSELKILVGVEALIDGELRHGCPSAALNRLLIENLIRIG